MTVIYILIPIAIIFTGLAIYLFFWAVKTEQFDDLEKQGMSILFDDVDNQQQKNSTKVQRSETITSHTENTDINAKITVDNKDK